MDSRYDLQINGLGNFIVDANIIRLPKSKSLECEIEITRIMRFDEETEEYVNYEPESDVLFLLENQVAVKFFNSLH